MSDERRGQLFGLAAAEFAAHGFALASLNRIISGAGMSKSSFYHYFENKSDLFRQTLEQTLAPYLEGIETFDFDVMTPEKFWSRLQAMTDEGARMAEEKPLFLDVGRMFYRALGTPEEAALTGNIQKIATGWTSGMIQRGQALGLVRDNLPESLLMDAVMAMAMATDRWFLKNWDGMDTSARTELSARTFDLFRRLLER